MRSHGSTLAVACGGAALVAVLLAAGIAQAGDEVPFKATSVTTITAETPGIFPVLATIITEGSGTSTHMGKFTVYGESTLTWTPAGLWLESAGTAVAASGDELYVFTYGWMPSPGDVEGWFTITGGTGRFLGATGSGTVSAELNEDGDAQTAIYEGAICYKKN